MGSPNKQPQEEKILKVFIGEEGEISTSDIALQTGMITRLADLGKKLKLLCEIGHLEKRQVKAPVRRNVFSITNRGREALRVLLAAEQNNAIG